MGISNAPAYRPERLGAEYALADIYSPELEAAARAAYARDYQVFGFGDWAPDS